MLLDTSMTRTRKFASLSAESVHAKPQLSAGPPRMYVALLVVSVAVDFVVVHDMPPSHDNCTQIFGALLVLSALASKPDFDALNRCSDRNVEAEVVEAVFVLLRVSA